MSGQADLSGIPDILLSNLSLTAADRYDGISLADVTVPLESIKPSKHKHQCSLPSKSVPPPLNISLKNMTNFVMKLKGPPLFHLALPSLNVFQVVCYR